MGGGGAEVWVPHPFPQPTSTVSDSGSYAILQPLLHQRGCSQGGHPRLNCQGCCGARSASFSGLLQPSVCRVEDLGVVASGHRPLPPQWLCGCVPLSNGDHTVCSPVGSSGRLDGLHRLERSVPAGSGTSGFSSFSTLCVRGSHFPIQSSVLWPLHGSTGLLTGHGSYFRHSPFLGYLHEAVPRRLASPVVLSGIPAPGSPDCPRALLRAGGCDQPGEIPPHTIPGGTVSRCRDQLPVFCGFTIARTHLQAAVNSRRISILCLASHEIMALASGHAFFAGSPSSWRQTADAVSPVVSQSILGSSRSLGSGILDRVLSSRSPVVAPPSSPLPRCVSLPSLTRPRLLVRHLRCRVGSSSGSTGRFRPLDLSTSISVHQRQGIAGHPTRSPLLSVVSTRSYGGSFLRQHHGSGVSPQRGRYQVSYAQHHSPGDPEVGGVPRHSSGSTVHPRLQQRPGGRSVSPSPAPSFRVVPQHDRLSIFVSSVAGPNRFICDLRKSSMFHLFLSLPGSSGGGHGCPPPVLGRSAGLRLPSVCHHSQSPCEAPGISGDGAHPSGSALGSAPLVCRSPPAVAGPSGHPSRSYRPPAPASLSAPLPGSPQATTSCLETLRRFTRAAGFSSAVAEQSSLARRPSSRAAYQLSWSVYRSWCHSHGHSVSRPSLAKVSDFLTWLRSSRRLGVSSIRGYHSMLSAVFRFHLPSLSSDPVLRDLLRSFKLSAAEHILRAPAWDLAKVLRYLNSPHFEPLSQASLRTLSLKILFLLALATAKRVGELQALSSIVTFVGVDACLSYIPQFVAKLESLTRSIPRFFLVKSLSDFEAGLDADLLLCPVRALRFYLDRTHSLAIAF